MSDSVTSWFHDPSEREVFVLGRSYLATLLRDASFGKGVLVLSDQRIYQRGLAFERLPNGKFGNVHGSRTVAVCDVTGMSWTQTQAIGLLMFGIALAIASALMVVLAAQALPTMQAMYFFFALLLMAATAGVFLAYNLSRRSLFVIEYPGGAIATDSRWFAASEIEEFQRHITTVKRSGARTA